MKGDPFGHPRATPGNIPHPPSPVSACAVEKTSRGHRRRHLGHMPAPALSVPGTAGFQVPCGHRRRSSGHMPAPVRSVPGTTQISHQPATSQRNCGAAESRAAVHQYHCSLSVIFRINAALQGLSSGTAVPSGIIASASAAHKPHLRRYLQESGFSITASASAAHKPLRRARLPLPASAPARAADCCHLRLPRHPAQSP